MAANLNIVVSPCLVATDSAVLVVISSVKTNLKKNNAFLYVSLKSAIAHFKENQLLYLHCSINFLPAEQVQAQIINLHETLFCFRDVATRQWMCKNCCLFFSYQVITDHV